MSYLSRLKQLADGEKFTHSAGPELTKPPKAPSVSSVSTGQGAYENISANGSAVELLPKVGAGNTAATSWGWRVTYPEDHPGDRFNGRVFEAYIVPQQTLAEVQAIHPGARIEPIAERAE